MAFGFRIIVKMNPPSQQEKQWQTWREFAGENYPGLCGFMLIYVDL
jgi:hypothetical protein